MADLFGGLDLHMTAGTLHDLQDALSRIASPLCEDSLGQSYGLHALDVVLRVGRAVLPEDAQDILPGLSLGDLTAPFGEEASACTLLHAVLVVGFVRIEVLLAEGEAIVYYGFDFILLSRHVFWF